MTILGTPSSPPICCLTCMWKARLPALKASLIIGDSRLLSPVVPMQHSAAQSHSCQNCTSALESDQGSYLVQACGCRASVLMPSPQLHDVRTNACLSQCLKKSENPLLPSHIPHRWSFYSVKREFAIYLQPLCSSYMKAQSFTRWWACTAMCIPVSEAQQGSEPSRAYNFQI